MPIIFEKIYILLRIIIQLLYNYYTDKNY